MGYNSSTMVRLYAIARALCHYLRLHFANPKLSKCMLVSMLLVIATAGPIARAQQNLSQARPHSCRANMCIVLSELLSTRRSLR